MAADGADMSELRELGVDLVKLANSARSRVRPVISRGALNIKKQLAAEMAASAAFKGAARQMSYDLRTDAHGVEAEIGPDKSRARKGHGTIATIAYFGGSRGGGGTVPDPQLALAAEAPTLLRYLTELVEEL